LLLSDGGKFPNHITLWSENQVLVRSRKGKMSDKCIHCGIRWYQRQANEQYVTRQSVDGVRVRISTEGFFIVDAVVAHAILKEKKIRGWRKLSLHPIDVLEHATDGLPDDLKESTQYLLPPAMHPIVPR
jgi:hypothetical protein